MDNNIRAAIQSRIEMGYGKEQVVQEFVATGYTLEDASYFYDVVYREMTLPPVPPPESVGYNSELSQDFYSETGINEQTQPSFLKLTQNSLVIGIVLAALLVVVVGGLVYQVGFSSTSLFGNEDKRVAQDAPDGDDYMNSNDAELDVEYNSYRNKVHGYDINYPDNFLHKEFDDPYRLTPVDAVGDMIFSSSEDDPVDKLIYKVESPSSMESWDFIPWPHSSYEEYVNWLHEDYLEPTKEKYHGGELAAEYMFGGTVERKVVTATKQNIEAVELIVINNDVSVEGGPNAYEHRATVFEYNGETYVISFTYLKDNPNTTTHLEAYNLLVSSINFEVNP